jgi:5-methyltetrahydrofolate--homocysteine methyltransferase
MSDRLTSLLAERPWLLADGATGSNLFERGLQSGDAPELWNADHPERVTELQRAFVEAGAAAGATGKRTTNRRNARTESP